MGILVIFETICLQPYLHDDFAKALSGLLLFQNIIKMTNKYLKDDEVQQTVASDNVFSHWKSSSNKPIALHETAFVMDL